MAVISKDTAAMMDIDIDNASCTLTPLKRYNSAPFINVSITDSRPTCESPTPTQSSSPRPCNGPSCNGPSCSSSCCKADKLATRRFSTSSVMLHSPSGLTKMPSRLDQIRLEESVTQRDREAAHEREIQSKMLMSQSWDELTLDDTEAMVTDVKRPRSFNEPLHIFTSMSPAAGSLSPVRFSSKQCFSPLLQQPVTKSIGAGVSAAGVSGAGSLSLSPSPSPTRKTTFVSRRSLSPIVLRPSPLSGVKRSRVESDSIDLSENYFSTPKRFRPSNCSPSGSCGSGIDLSTYPHLELRVRTSSVSCSSVEDNGSSDERDLLLPSVSVTTLDYIQSAGFTISRPSPAATSIASSSSPSSPFVFHQQDVVPRDSVESLPASDSSAATAAAGDSGPGCGPAATDSSSDICDPSL